MMDGRRARRFAITTAIALAAIYCFAAVSIAVFGLRDDIAVADVAIIPGNTVQRDGTPSARLAARLERAIELYREKNIRDIIVSGGIGEEGCNEAAVMKQYLVAHGIPGNHIYPDSNGLTTYHTARNSARIMKAHGWRNAMVVSQYFHIPRTMLAVERSGISPVYSAHANYFELRDIYSLMREVPGYFDYLFRSYE
ncbi:MAG: putative rane protein [Chlorobi bacterium]|nr:putative rane protein [Chlorobiota bacterium]